MELGPSTADVYFRLAFTQMLQVAERLGDEKVTSGRSGPETNAVAPLIIHCCGVTEFWLGHVALGRPSHRDRDSEFTAVATIRQLHDAVELALSNASADLRRLHAGEGRDTSGLRQQLQDGDTTDAAVVLHVIEELFQHLGHMEIAANALGR